MIHTRTHSTQVFDAAPRPTVGEVVRYRMPGVRLSGPGRTNHIMSWGVVREVNRRTYRVQTSEHMIRVPKTNVYEIVSGSYASTLLEMIEVTA